ncbi:ankyrin repeat-containing domain protein [Pestalotiopsis sp. NC0098]|nr:ankyrin repeat-containing domain protein [Pestalotiopsis sp. NC0098]
MAPTPIRSDVALEHCKKATVLGNSISIHMLDFLSTVKSHPLGFDELAHDFLEVCRIMWSLEAGLLACAKGHQDLPTEMLLELDKKFRTTHSDFQILDQWINRFLEYERKGSVGKFWRKMKMADTGVDKMRESLAKTKETLRMSALIFQWSLGDAKIDEAVGIGYTGLAAALDRMDRGKSVLGISKLKSLEPHMVAHSLEEVSAIESLHQSSLHQASLHPSSIDRSFSPSYHHVPPVLEIPRGSTTDLSPFPGRDDLSARSIPDLHFPSLIRRTSISDHTVSSHGGRDRVISGETYVSSGHGSHHPSHGHARIDERLSDGTNGHSTLLGSEDEADLGPIKVVRVKADPFTMPRWSPRNTVSPTPALKEALVTAVEARNSKMVEQLLDRGVPADNGPDEHVLCLAVRRHDVETVRLLLLFGADPNLPEPTTGHTPLYTAVEESFLDGASMLLKYGAGPNLSPTSKLETPLALSVIEDKFNFTRLLLTYGQSDASNHLTNDGDTLLVKATSQKSSKKMIELLLEYGADVNGKNREGKSALFDAIQTGRPDVVTMLIDHGANVNLPAPKHMLWVAVHRPDILKIILARGADHRKAPGILELATSINNYESVKILINSGVDINAKKDGIYTPLCSSIRDARSDIFHLLLSSGADPNTASAEYPCFKCVTHNRVQFLDPLVKAGGNLLSPKGILETAVQHNNVDAINWLLDHDVPMNEKVPKTGATALTTAIRENRPELVDLLLERGADPNVRGQDWPVCMAVRQPKILKNLLPALAEPRAFKGVMEMAVVANQLDSIKLLLRAGVSVEDRNGGVFSPLTTAIREHHTDIVKFLIFEAHADVNAPGEHLPIVKALRRMEGNDTSTLTMLLDAGADPNKVYRGHNAIIQALENGDVEVLKLLVDRAGVDLDARDESGKTVLELAQSRGGDEASEVLLKARRVHASS